MADAGHAPLLLTFRVGRGTRITVRRDRIDTAGTNPSHCGTLIPHSDPSKPKVQWLVTNRPDLYMTVKRVTANIGRPWWEL
jgi:hypothetical protein